MIVKMCKIRLLARQDDRDRLLEALYDLAAMHLVPVEVRSAQVAEAVAHQLRQVELAIGLLELAGAGDGNNWGTLDLDEAVGIAEEVAAIQQRMSEAQVRLEALRLEQQGLEMWRGVRLESIRRLADAGVTVRCFSIPREDLRQTKAEFVEEAGDLPGGRVLVMIAVRQAEPEVAASAIELQQPPRDVFAIQTEAQELDQRYRADSGRLTELSEALPALRAARFELQRRADHSVALRSGLSGRRLFAMQGWVPQERTQDLQLRLRDEGIVAAVEPIEPDPDEQPPTLVRPPRWARPIEGLFGILGTVPGYREFDISVLFFLSLPLFAAILISDGGYGLMLLAGLLLGRGWATRTLGPRMWQLMLVVSGAVIAWGLIIGSFFGVTLYTPLIEVGLDESAYRFLMRLSFTIGAVHLGLSQLWRAVAEYPDLRFLRSVGWGMFLWGMYGVVLMLVMNDPMGWDTPWPWLLIVGAALTVGFTDPQGNVLVAIGKGLMGLAGSITSAFADVMSYVRLMAVGLASAVLGATFNQIAVDLTHWSVAPFVIAVGHGLTFALGMIAVFAHGVRLNMLEFSNNLGMRWSGYGFSPFARRGRKEQLDDG